MKRTIVISTVFMLVFVAGTLIMGVPYAHADSTNSGASNTGSPAVQLVNPLGTTSLTTLVNGILQFAIRIGAIVVILALVYIGFEYVTVARSNPDKISEVHRKLLWVVIGALVLLGAQAISYGICETVNALSTSGSTISCSPL